MFHFRQLLFANQLLFADHRLTARASGWQFAPLFLVLFLALPGAYSQSTDIAVNASIVQPQVKRLGINLSYQDYYDSGQMTANLISNNPGFEGEIYNSTIRCTSGTATTCVDDNASDGAWQSGFWTGATYEIFYGTAQGRTGTIASYTAGNGTVGGTFTFANSGVAPAQGDYMIVRASFPGNAQAGWWPSTSGAGAIATNTTDLPPGTTGQQTVALTAPGATDSAAMVSYFDSVNGMTFVQLNGTYQLSFKAKGTGGANAIAVLVGRNQTYLSQTVSLTDSWNTYNLSFTAAENGTAIGAVQVSFATTGQDSFELDDTSLTQTNGDPTNTTGFRDAVVDTLQTLNPGVMRFWALQLGDTLDNLIADQFGRQRSGYSAWANVQNDISYGLPDFLALCQTTGAEPWFVVPSTFSTTDAANLIEYLAGSSTTPYGAKRAAAGQFNPWTQSFPIIHLEFGNEAWNSTFTGGSIEYAAPYGSRAQTIFAAMRGDASYNAAAFDLILGGQAVNPGYNASVQDNCNNNDSFTIGPYMMSTVDSFSNNQQLFAPTFAEPEAFMLPSGVAEGVTGGLIYLNQQALLTSSHPVPLEVYEVNMSTTGGSITQAALNGYASSVGAGLAVADGMLQQMRGGLITQNMFALPQYQFERPDGLLVDLWGSVIDMGVTNRKRPQFLAVQLANQAITNGASMLQTVQSGSNPTWDQPLTNTVQLSGAHDLQSFAFQNGENLSLIVFNLELASSLPVTFSGLNAPQGAVQMQQLTSVNLTDTNETANVVAPTTAILANFNPSAGLSLPPFSMTLLTWQSGNNPPPVISQVAASSVAAYSAVITWTTDQPSSSQVEYGATANYGATSPLDSTLVTAHSVTLTGLQPGTIYNYAAMSQNAGNAFSVSDNFTFTTVARGLTISAVAASGFTTTSALITWTTNQPSTSQVEYGTSISYGSTSPLLTPLVTSHSVLLSGLTPGTAYDFAVESTNVWGRLVTSTNASFTTTAIGTVPQVFAVADWGATGTGITISWSTDLAANTAVQYGTTPALGNTSPVAASLTNNHSVILTGLVPNTLYYFVAQSANAAGITGYSTTFTFQTLDTIPPVISNIVAAPHANSTTSLTFSVSEPAVCVAQYGPTTSYGSWSTQTPLTQSGQVSFAWVLAGTTHYIVTCNDSFGNSATSPDATFTEP